METLINLQSEIEKLNQLLNGTGVILSYESLLANSRRGDYVFQRAIMSRYLRNKKLSYMHIGRLLNRNHATILHMMKYKPTPIYKLIAPIIDEAARLETEQHAYFICQSCGHKHILV